MRLTSPAFVDNGYLPAIYSYGDQNLNPPLAISAVPVKTRSLALIVHDPDAPGQDFCHWLVWNLPADTRVINIGQLPTDAVEGLNDFKHRRWDGPAPPSGTHRYIFELSALDQRFNVSPAVSRSTLETMINQHVLEQTQLTVRFSTN